MLKKLEQQALLMEVGLVAAVPDLLEGQRPFPGEPATARVPLPLGKPSNSLHTNLQLAGG